TYKMYSEKYAKRYKYMIPLMAKFLKPKDKSRFITIAESCLTCNSYDELDKIKCPVFVIGGKEDKVVSAKASYEIAEKLCCEIYMYDNLGHAAHEEAKDFNKRVMEFLDK
ncbi:MAG: alpha/beta hydrolase, partial [Clostridia bacterium]|nr:alpha/beta hydrolase [Clostridia bacterium]